jgi:hypothetical protein
MSVRGKLIVVYHPLEFGYQESLHPKIKRLLLHDSENNFSKFVIPGLPKNLRNIQAYISRNFLTESDKLFLKS